MQFIPSVEAKEMVTSTEEMCTPVDSRILQREQEVLIISSHIKHIKALDMKRSLEMTNWCNLR